MLDARLRRERGARRIHTPRSGTWRRTTPRAWRAVAVPGVAGRLCPVGHGARSACPTKRPRHTGERERGAWRACV